MKLPQSGNTVPPLERFPIFVKLSFSLLINIFMLIYIFTLIYIFMLILINFHADIYFHVDIDIFLQVLDTAYTVNGQDCIGECATQDEDYW